jgi:tetratricopeptide (TPR) repeat protein
VELDPRHPGALNQIGVLFGRAGRHQEAAEYFTRAVETRRDSAVARYNLAVAERHLGRHDLAVKELERVVAIDPRHLQAYDKLASSYRALGRARDAEEVLERKKAVEQSPAEER